MWASGQHAGAGVGRLKAAVAVGFAVAERSSGDISAPRHGPGILTSRPSSSRTRYTGRGAFPCPSLPATLLPAELTAPDVLRALPWPPERPKLRPLTASARAAPWLPR